MTDPVSRHRPIGHPDPKRVLVVDDDAPVRSMMAQALARAGFHVLQASTGLEARDTVESLSGEIDLVVMDVVLPGMEGYEAVSLMKVKYPDLKVLYVSGYSSPQVSRVDVVRGESEAFLRKPFGIDELVDAVRSETADS